MKKRVCPLLTSLLLFFLHMDVYGADPIRAFEEQGDLQALCPQKKEEGRSEEEFQPAWEAPFKPKIGPEEKQRLEAQAADAVYRGNNEEAVHDYLFLHQAFPDNRDYLNELATSYLRLRNYGESEKMYRESLRLEPHDVDALLGLAVSDMLQDKLEDATTQLEKILDIGPNSVQANLFQGYIYLKVGMPKDALPYFKEVLKGDPHNIEAQEAVAYTKNYNRYKYAAEEGSITPETLLCLSLEQYLQNQSYGSLLSQAQAAAENQKYKEAISIVRPLYLKYPYNPRYSLLLGNYYAADKNLGEAKRAYKRAMRVDPENLETHTALANIYAKQGEIDKAISLLEFVLRRQPYNASVNQLMGDLYIEKGDIEEGNYYYNRSQEGQIVDPQDPDYFYRRGNFYAIHEQWGEAEADYTHSLRLGGEESEVRLNRAKALFRQGKIREADEDIQFVLEKDPSNTDALQIKGDLYEIEGYPQKALAAYQYIISMPPNPKSADYLAQLGHYYYLSLCIPEAERAFKEALIAGPGNRDAMLGLSQVYLVTSRYAQAEELLLYLLKFPLTNSFRSDVEQVLGDVYAAQDNRQMAAYFFNYSIEHSSLYDRALLEFRRGKYNAILYNRARAQMSYKEALQINPHFAAAELALADISIQQGELQEAERMLSDYLRRHPGDVEARISMGNAFIAEGDPKVAGDFYASIFEQPQQPWSAEYYFRIGTYYELRQCYREAREAFTQGLTIDPCNGELLSALGEAYLRDNLSDRGLAQWDYTLSIHPNYATALQNLGDYFAGKGDFDLGLYYYQSILSYDPNNWGVKKALQLREWLIHLFRLEKCKFYCEAIAFLENTILPTYPNAAVHYAKLGEIYLNISNYACASAAFKKAIELSYNALDAWVGVAQVDYHFGCTTRAKQILHNVLNLSYTHAVAHEILGDIYTNQGHYGLGACNYTTSLSLEPNNPEVCMDLNFLYHDYRITRLVPNCDTRYVFTLAVEHSKELGKGFVDQSFTNDLFTNVWNLSGHYYLNNKWVLFSSLEQFNQRENDLILQEKIIEANMYILKGGAEWYPNGNWTWRASLGGLRGLGHHQTPDTNFFVHETYRFQPSIEFEYENVDVPYWVICPHPRRHVARGWFFQETIMPLSWSEPNAHLIDVRHLGALYEFRCFPPYTGIGIEGEYRNYQDPSRNNYGEVMVWIRSAIPRWRNTVDLRFQIPYRTFTRPVPEYYSYKWQIEPQIKVSLQKNWCFSWQGEFFYSHGWRLSHDLISPLQNGPGFATLQPSQNVNTNELEAIIRKNMCDQLTLFGRGFYYWDSSDYQVYTVSGELSFNF